MKITRTSLLSGQTNTMDLDITPAQAEEMARPRDQRRNVQDIVPHLTPDEREFLATGITQWEWDVLGWDDVEDGKGEEDDA